MNNNNPKSVSEMLAETVEMVNNLTADEARKIEHAHGYGGPGDYRSFWD